VLLYGTKMPARRISIDTLGLMSPKSASFEAAKRRSRWSSAPRLLTTCVFFGVLWLWFNIGTSEILIPADSFEYLKDESLRDILNTTLGVGQSTLPTSLAVYDRLTVANLRLLCVTDSSKFEKILVLNLPFRTDRRDAMSLSAAISNIKLEFVEGVKGADINDKAYPPPEENRKHSPGIRGSWRTHMNALQRYQAQSQS
jgi:hypothetical protein